MSKRKTSNPITWILDECVTPNKSSWLVEDKDNLVSLKELSLLGTKDEIISNELKKRFPNNRIVIITKNIHKDKTGDYFSESDTQGIVRFSPSISTKEEQKEYFEKFTKMFKNSDKLQGAIISISKLNITYKKGNKTKILKYRQYI